MKIIVIVKIGNIIIVLNSKKEIRARIADVNIGECYVVIGSEPN